MKIYLCYYVNFMLFGKKKYSFSCEDIGMKCGYQVKGASSEDELLQIIKIHAEKAHGLKQINQDLIENIKKNIKKK
ncbi:DUF1059 domain-containing protein [Stygiolobus caldivivus]|uniref:DUF1059 domain-containing protein n=1 Tax=Stygiolobus caldivivus TaxID=2824673 RepID=A0A8D5U736_9CREN|nr:DUF1059 domain-containing protein [Stygiolobus caldivivus]BCU70900.1 hypothetical protein KN1_21970 [Stygiolobus caldivivus]